MKDSKTLQLLVKQAGSGDVESFGKIYDELIDRVYRFVFFRVGVKEETEDLTEEIFLKIFKNIGEYKQDGDIPFEAWVFRIARNSVIDYYRTKKKNLPIDDAIEIQDGKKGPEEQTIEKVSVEEVIVGLQKIPSSYQEIIILKFIEDRGNDEISNILNKPVDQIRVLQSRALKSLRRVLESINSGSIGINYEKAPT